MIFDYSKVTIRDQIRMLKAQELFSKQQSVANWFEVAMTVANKCADEDLFELPSDQMETIMQTFTTGLLAHSGENLDSMWSDELNANE